MPKLLNMLGILFKIYSYVPFFMSSIIMLEPDLRLHSNSPATQSNKSLTERALACAPDLGNWAATIRD
jgi:hypothetical protein